MLVRVGGLRVGGVAAPLQCLRACMSAEGEARMFGVGERDRSCYCIRGMGSPEEMGMAPAAAEECKPPSCRTDAVGADALPECPTLLNQGLSCGEYFCGDGSRCELAGMCAHSCGIPEDSSTCSDAQSHSRLQLYAIESAAVPTAVLPRSVGATPCATRRNETTCPVALRRKTGSAVTACCACGGGTVNSFGACSDHLGFRDTRGYTCTEYAARRLCSDDGFGAVGPGWNAGWGPFNPDALGQVAHQYMEASLEAVISMESRERSRSVLAVLEDEEPLSTLSSEVSIAQRGLATWKGALTDLQFRHRDDPSRLGITLAPLAGTHVEIQGQSVMAPCGFHSVRALTATKACRSCDAWWDTRAERPGAALAQGGRGAKWYYELVVGSDGIAQVGFATHGFMPGTSQGVGDDPYSWGFDGNRLTKWHDPTPDVDDGTLEEWQTASVNAEDGANDYGEEWYEGDIVGCLLDLSEPNGGSISFTLTTPGEETRNLGTAFVLQKDQRSWEFYPAGTFVEGVWTFRFAPEDLQYAPEGVEHFTPPTRMAKLIRESSSLAALPATISTDGCQDMLVEAVDPDVNLFYSFSLTRPTPAPKGEGISPQICARPIEPFCDSSALGADTMVMWIILGAAAAIGFLTMFTMVQGERLRRRRQFQLITGATLQLDNESVHRVLPDEDARANFRQKFEQLQRMLHRFGRNGLIDITVTRETLLRDVIELFDFRPEILEPGTLRSQGLRIRFTDELGIDEGGLRREFFQVLFGAFVSPCAVRLAMPIPEEAVPPEMDTADAQTILALFEELPGYAYGINRSAAAAVHRLGTESVAAMVRNMTYGHSDEGGSTRLAAGFGPDAVDAIGMDGAIELSEIQPAVSRTGKRSFDVPQSSTQAYLLQDGEHDRSSPARHMPRLASSSSFDLEPEPEPELEYGTLQRRIGAGGASGETPRLAQPAPPQPGTMGRVAALRRPRMARLRRLTSLPAVREALRRIPSGTRGSGSHSSTFVNDLMQAEPLALYRMCGMFLAKAIIDDVRLNVIFTRALYSQLLSQPVGLDELKDIDEELHSSLEWLLHTDLNDEEQLEGGAESLGLYFDAMLPSIAFDGAVTTPEEAQTIELKAGGAEILVTQENKEEFVALRAAFAHTGLVESQIQSMREGFFYLLPDFARLEFDGAELELLLHGVPDINDSDWKFHTVYRGGYDEDHPTVVAFWAIVGNMDQQMRGKLLHFTTGCSRVPLEGFSALRGDGRICRFTIACTDQALDELPVRCRLPFMNVP